MEEIRLYSKKEEKTVLEYRKVKRAYLEAIKKFLSEHPTLTFVRMTKSRHYDDLPRVEMTGEGTMLRIVLYKGTNTDQNKALEDFYRRLNTIKIYHNIRIQIPRITELDIQLHILDPIKDQKNLEKRR